MAKNAATVVGKPAAIPEVDGGRDMMIQPVYITWIEKNGRVELMRQWANVRIIDDKAFDNLRVDIELLRPIEWSLKEVAGKRDGEPLEEEKMETEKKGLEV